MSRFAPALSISWNQTPRGDWDTAHAAGVGTYQQDWAYGVALKAASPDVEVLRAAVRRGDGAVMALAQVVARPFALVGRFALCTHGPVWVGEVSAEEKREAYGLLRKSLPQRWPRLLVLTPDEEAGAGLKGLSRVMTGDATVLVDLTRDEAALKSGEPKTVTLYHYEGEMKSGMGVGEVDRFFRNLRDQTVATRLVDRGLSADLVKPFEIKRQNVAPPEKVGGNIIGGLVPYMIIILCFTGAMYPAIDLTAGEKERGTMETLLCSPVHRVNIVLGKFLMVMTASIATIALTLISTAVSIIIGGNMLAGKGAAAAKAAGGAGSGFIPLIDPAGILGVFAMIAPVAVVFAALLLTISLAAKSYKEAQSYVSPLIIVVIMPAMMGMLPGIELNAKTALNPRWPAVAMNNPLPVIFGDRSNRPPPARSARINRTNAPSPDGCQNATPITATAIMAIPRSTQKPGL